MGLQSLYPFLKHLGHHRRGRCTVCGRSTLFLIFDYHEGEHVRDRLFCVFCKAVSRQRQMAKAILSTLETPFSSLYDATPLLRTKRIYNTVSNDPLSRLLSKDNPNYLFSEYFPDVAPGAMKNGILCQNLEALTFSEAQFDYVFTEDVLEHVRLLPKALSEIARVLKPGGYHIFTIPFTPDSPTIERIEVGETPQMDTHRLPAEYHGDPIRGEIIAYRNFGYDLFSLLPQFGFKTQLMTTTFHDSRRHGIYDSMVFLSQKLPSAQRI